MKFNSKNERIIILCIFIISFLIRLFFGIFIFEKTGTKDFCDDWDYISYAKNIIEQGPLIPDLSKFFSNSYLVAPGYPLVIAIFFKIFGVKFLPIIIFNAFISALISVLIYFLGKMVFSKKVAFYSSIWSIFYVFFIKYVPHILKEEFNIFLFLLTIILFILSLKNENKKFLIIFSLVFSFLIHTDERFFIYFPFFIVVFLFHKRNSLKRIIYFSLIVLLTMIPWLIRNYIVYSRIVIITERTALITDKILGYEGKNNFKKNKDFKFYQAVTDSIKNGKIVKSDFHFKKGLINAIKLGYNPHNFNITERLYEEFKEFWRPFRFKAGFVANGFRFEPPWSLKHNFSLILTYGILLPFFIVGIIFGILQKNHYIYFFLSIIIIHTLIHIFIIGVRNRYRIPIDPLIIIIAFYGYTEIINLKQKKYFKKLYFLKNFE